MIVAQNLSKKFGKVVAVDSINFRIPRGKVVGFLGPNGAGKTTVIRMIAGYLSPSAGTVQVDGMDVTARSLAVRRRIGYLPESTPLYAEMRVGEYLGFLARLYGISRRRRRSAIEAAMLRCWLQEVRRRPIRQLSRGFRQRVGLAAALLHQPPVLILDEPTVGLDPTQILEVRSLIRELAGRHTVLLSTHILPEAERSCDEIIMIARGRVRAQGSIDNLQTAAARGSRYIVETDTDDLVGRISALPGVHDVERKRIDGQWCRLIVTPAAGVGDLREPIGRVLAEGGAVVREIRREAPTLEQMFVQLAEENGRPAPGAGEEAP